MLDRVFYTMGAHAGKALLLVGQLLVTFWYCLSLFWSPLETSGGAKAHLRAFILLRCASFACSALQLRSGYPPPASYRRAVAHCALLPLSSGTL